MVRLRSSSKHRKVQTKLKNKKKKRNSVSRGTETDFDQVDDTNAVDLNDSFGIWMGGKTSTPEKRDASPTSAWYPHRRIDTNDHSAHSIVFFEETLDSSKSEIRFDSPDRPSLDPNTNICKTSHEDNGQEKSPKLDLWQPDTLNHLGSVKDEPGTLVFESTGKVFFRRGEEKESTNMIEDFQCDSHDKGSSGTSSKAVHETEAVVTMEENLKLSNENYVHTSNENEGEREKCYQRLRKEEVESGFSRLNNTNRTKPVMRSSSNRCTQSGNFKGQNFPINYITDDVYYVTQSTSVSDEANEEEFVKGLKGEHKENRSPLGQISNKSRSRRCIALRGCDVMANFDDAMEDLKGKLETFYDSEIDRSGRTNPFLNRSSSVKFMCQSTQKPIECSPKLTSLNIIGCDDDRSKALSDITNKANFVRARYRAPVDVNIREPSMVTSRAIPTQRKSNSIPDKHIYTNLPSMMFPCLTNNSQTCDVSYHLKESKRQRKEECFIFPKTPLTSLTIIPDYLQSVGYQLKFELSESLEDDSTRGKENSNPVDTVNSPLSISQTENVLLARNRVQPYSHGSSDVSSELTQGTVNHQQPEHHRYNSSNLPKPSRPESHGFPLLTSNISIPFQETVPLKVERSDDNPYYSQLSDTQELRYNSPVSDNFQMPYETDNVGKHVNKLKVINRQTRLKIDDSSTNRRTETDSSQHSPYEKLIKRTERLTTDGPLLLGKQNVISKVPKLLEFYENHSVKTPPSKPRSRRSCMPIISTMSVSSRVNIFEQNTERYISTDEPIAVGKEISRYESVKMKADSSKPKTRRSLPAFSTVGYSSNDKFTTADKSYERGLESNQFETVFHTAKEAQKIPKQHTSKRQHGKPPSREAIVLFEFSSYVTRKREPIVFQRGEVVQVLGNWIDGQVRVRKCLDKVEAILPRKCLFFISGDASITKKAGNFLSGSNYSEKASTDEEYEEKPNHPTEANLLEPFLVVKPYIAESTNDVTVLRGEVIIMNAQLAREAKSDWSWVYVPRTQSFGFIPSSVARSLTFEPVTECTPPQT